MTFCAQRKERNGKSFSGLLSSRLSWLLPNLISWLTECLKIEVRQLLRFCCDYWRPLLIFQSTAAKIPISVSNDSPNQAYFFVILNSYIWFTCPWIYGHYGVEQVIWRFQWHTKAYRFLARFLNGLSCCGLCAKILDACTVWQCDCQRKWFYHLEFQKVS